MQAYPHQIKITILGEIGIFDLVLAVVGIFDKDFTEPVDCQVVINLAGQAQDIARIVFGNVLTVIVFASPQISDADTC